jgi:hypothetical protein
MIKSDSRFDLRLRYVMPECFYRASSSARRLDSRHVVPATRQAKARGNDDPANK